MAMNGQAASPKPSPKGRKLYSLVITLSILENGDVNLPGDL